MRAHRFVPFALFFVACAHEGASLEVSTDTAGVCADALEEILSTWSTKYPTKRFPKLLYTMCASYLLLVSFSSELPAPSPTGSNPTGCSSPLDRKEKILALARKYNLLILEDDAYHFLAFDSETQAPSYFELEARNGGTTGRVVRFDSFSKILSSGTLSCVLGFVGRR